jgi:large subunit ribosomal protein L23
MNLTHQEIIQAPLLTEKSNAAMDVSNTVCFRVDKRANKHQIREAVETLFKVKVESVRTSVMPGKWRRVRWRPGYTGDWKKARVKLKAGHTIRFFETE